MIPSERGRTPGALVRASSRVGRVIPLVRAQRIQPGKGFMASRGETWIHGGTEVVGSGLERLRLLEARTDVDSTEDTQHLYQTADLLKIITLRSNDGRSGRDCEQEDLVQLDLDG